MRVFVLLFNARTENEGIHTVRSGDRNKILMFESEDDATRFALMLEAQDFAIPTVEAIDDVEVKQFCEQADYDWELVPQDTGLVVPPEINVEETDWKPDALPEDKTGNQDSQQEQEISDAELDRFRRKLEGLL